MIIIINVSTSFQVTTGMTRSRFLKIVWPTGPNFSSNPKLRMLTRHYGWVGMFCGVILFNSVCCSLNMEWDPGKSPILWYQPSSKNISMKMRHILCMSSSMIGATTILGSVFLSFFDFCVWSFSEMDVTDAVNIYELDYSKHRQVDQERWRFTHRLLHEWIMCSEQRLAFDWFASAFGFQLLCVWFIIFVGRYAFRIGFQNATNENFLASELGLEEVSCVSIFVVDSNMLTFLRSLGNNCTRAQECRLSDLWRWKMGK